MNGLGAWHNQLHRDRDLAPPNLPYFTWLIICVLCNPVIIIQLTIEQHWFELCQYTTTCMQISPPTPSKYSSPFSSLGSTSADWINQDGKWYFCNQNCSFWPADSWGTKLLFSNPTWLNPLMWRTYYRVKSYTRMFHWVGVGTPNHMLFTDQLYRTFCELV